MAKFVARKPVGISRNELINQMIAFALDNMDDETDA